MLSYHSLKISNNLFAEPDQIATSTRYSNACGYRELQIVKDLTSSWLTVTVKFQQTRANRLSATCIQQNPNNSKLHFLWASGSQGLLVQVSGLYCQCSTIGHTCSWARGSWLSGQCGVFHKGKRDC